MAKAENLIFRMQNLLDAIEADTGIATLDPTSKDILKFVGRAEIDQAEVNVSDIAGNIKFGSPAKIMGRLAKLERDGWLRAVVDPADGRAKLITLSQRSRKAFGKMSDGLCRLLTNAKH